MSELKFEAAGAGALLRADVTIEPGTTVVLSASPAALAALVALASGAQTPQRGRVVIDGASPSTTPALRRRVAALLAFEFFPLGVDVRSAVERVLRARGDDQNVDTLLETLGLIARARAPVNTLDAGERRSLALGLALYHARASVLALFEPLAATHCVEPARIRELLAERAHAGAIVLVATSSHDVAAAFGGAHLEIEGGTLRAAVPHIAPSGVPCALYVETSAPHELLGAVSTDPAVHGVFWNEQQAPDLVSLSGNDLDALGRAVTRAATERGIPVLRVSHSAAALPHSAAAALPHSAAAYPPPAPGYAADTFVPPPSAHPLDPRAARPPDQSVSMPTAFADPTRRGAPPEGS